MNDQNDTPEPSDSTDRPTERPLGFWLRAVDALLDREFARAFEGEGIDRRDWMLLNALSGDVRTPGLAERLARGGKRVRRFAARGWAAQDDTGAWTLTAEGRATQERLGASVAGIRERVAGAVSPDDFATTMASLEAIARELGWDETAPQRFGRRGFGPRPQRPDFRSGFGPNLHHGFGPRHGFDPRGRDAFTDGEHRRHDRGHHAPGHHGHGGCDHHSDHDHHDRHRAVEDSYARGFDAGFTAAKKHDPAA